MMMEEKCVESIIEAMKLNHLKKLIELFHIQMKGNKKEDYIKKDSKEKFPHTENMLQSS